MSGQGVMLIGLTIVPIPVLTGQIKGAEYATNLLLPTHLNRYTFIVMFLKFYFQRYTYCNSRR